MPWRLTLIATGLLAVALLFAGYRAQQRELTTLARSRDALAGQLAQRDRQIAALAQQAQQRMQAEQALHAAQTHAAQTLQTREQRIEREQHEHPIDRAWAAAALPADVSRLHQRPAFTRASDYVRWLSDRPPLPDPTQPARH
ncbi:Rz-like lysis system protein LysB [Chimaeribacter arupi]|jgi:LysB family phage lysis regulatory protein|uniref:Rz-like lysis system protein LysB n=1 Tax=Chimaeribacter arupi TaxID=2060066 RepID=UPI000C7E0515|nr:Rz-like lysis system protein LysB [Chimaeribacter arupi]PLR33177.1 transcriptional regulator [Chimaeribacter arupi]